MDLNINELHRLIKAEKKRMLPPSLKESILSLLKGTCISFSHVSYVLDTYEEVAGVDLKLELKSLSANDLATREYLAAISVSKEP
jgi:hypothetical protein